MGEMILKARELARHYEVRKGFLAGSATLKALSSASFELETGRTLAVVGESGCGKSTLARLVTQIEPPTSGILEIDGEDVAGADKKTRERLREEVQIVFQDPYGSLNPRKKVGTILEEPLVINRKLSAAERREQAQEMLSLVGLRAEHYNRYPHMFSGGQRQRIAIARALMLRPRILVADEPVSALDVSVQAQVLNLLMDLQEKFDLAYLFISHDLSVVRHIADEVMVMYLGRVVVPLKGELPSPLNPPSGCAFHRRCPFATERCSAERPELREIGGHLVACHHGEGVLDGTAAKKVEELA
ncbi:MAG: dipeptide ABC transporter ATP-binding protein [Limibacillus sp.]